MLGKDDYAIRSFPPDNRPVIWAQYSDDKVGIDLKSVRMYVDGVDATAAAKITANRIEYQLPKSLTRR